MSRLAARLRYFFADAWDEFRHSPGANLLATAMLAAVLAVAATAVLVFGNVRHQIERARAEATLELFLRDDADAEAVASLRHDLERSPGVERVEHVGKEEALRRFRLTFTELADLPGELGTNPLPESLEVWLRQGPQASTAAREIIAASRQRAIVEDVRFDQEWLARLDELLDTARDGGAILSVIGFVAVAFLMAAVLRLAVLARQDEIDIMMLVGATPGFVRGPFVVAGLIQGAVAAAAALATLEFARRAALVWAGARGTPALQFLVGRPPSFLQAAAVVGVGALVGAAAAFLAVRGVRSAPAPQKS